VRQTELEDDVDLSPQTFQYLLYAGGQKKRQGNKAANAATSGGEPAFLVAASAPRIVMDCSQCHVLLCRRVRVCSQVSPWVTGMSCVLVAVGLAVW
jgi:hypothetical protein